MTEYEIADLAMSRQMEIQGLSALFMAQIDSQHDVVQQFMTVLFGFLAAAHFIGSKLSRPQVLLFSSLYVAWQIWAIFIHAIRSIGLENTLEAMIKIGAINPAAEATTDALPSIAQGAQIVLLSVALIASLYFCLLYTSDAADD